MVNYEKYNRKLLFFYFIIVSLVVIAPLAGGKLFVLAATALFCVGLLTLKTPSMYVLLLGMFPFANIFKLSPSSSSMLTICELILSAYVIVVYGVIRQKTRVKELFLMSLLAFVGYITLISGGGGALPIIKLAVRLILLYTFFYLDTDVECREETVRMMAYTLGMSMLLMMLLSNWSFYMDKIHSYLRIVQYGQGLDVLRNSGVMGDPNYCSLAIMVTLSFLTVLYFYKRINWVYWLISVPLFLLGFFTYSKSYMLCAAAFVMLLLVYVLFPRHKAMALLVLIVAAVGLGMAASGKIEVINMILDRFDAKDITTGRSDLNKVYWRYITGDPWVFLFGAGFNVQRLSVDRYVYNNVHNLYLEMMFQIGLVGTSLFVLTVYSCLPKMRFRRRLVNYIPAAFALIMYMALAGLGSYELIYYILIGAGAVYFITDKQKGDKRVIA